LALHENTYGEAHLETATMLAEVGRIFRAQGDQERAQDCLGRALRTHRSLLGEAAPEVFDDLQQLAGSLEDAGDLAGAAEQFETALHIKQRQLGIVHLEPFAEMQYSLAILYTGWGNYSRARELLAECIGTFRNTGGPRLAVSYEMLAQVEERSGHHLIALNALESAGKVWEKCGAGRIAELVSNLEYRADLLDEMSDPRKASWLRERANGLRTSVNVSEDDRMSEMAAGTAAK
jgi:serine/threonine-protein kinase